MKRKTSSGKLNIVRIDDEELSSSSSMSLYNIESNEKHSEVSSQRTPTMIENQVPEQLEKVHSSLTTDKNQFERHSQVQQEEEDLLSYNIDEIFETFTFNIYKKEVSQKRIRNEKQNDGTFKEVQEDEVLFERIDEDPVTVATSSAALSQATVHNVNVLSEKLSQAESDNNKLKEEVINLKAEIHKRRKVDDETTPLRATILDQHAKLYDVRMECFDKVKKMVDKVKMIEKHLDIVSQTHQKMRDLQEKIIELDEWRSTKRDIPNNLPSVKSYDIIVYSMATEECQDLASWFEENARKDLAGMMDLYEKTTYDIQRYIQWPEINFEENHPVPITVFKEIEKDFERVKAEVQAKKEFSVEDI